jgi:hypothetical protein
MAKSQELRRLGFLFPTFLGCAGVMAVGWMTAFGTACGMTGDVGGDAGNGSADTAGGSTGNTSEGGCVSADASIATILALDAGPPGCFSCVTSTCASAVTKCSKDCTCNDMSVGAFECIENLGPNASLTSEVACITPLVSTSDQDLKTLGMCLFGCAGPCEATAGEAEADSGALDSASDSEPTDAGSDSSMDAKGDSESADAKGDSEPPPDAPADS